MGRCKEPDFCTCKAPDGCIAESERELEAVKAELAEREQQLNVAVNALLRLAESFGWRPTGMYSEGEISSRINFAVSALIQLGVKRYEADARG
jgi:hypothetical protein